MRPTGFPRLLVPLLLLALACGPARREDDDTADPVCGDGFAEAAEACDGAALKDQSCGSLGLGTGQLACKADCSDLDTTGCSDHCEKDCTGRRCGPDPKCGLSCGTCTTGQACNVGGQCEAVDPKAPVIRSLGTNVPSITEGGSVTVTAVVTDPDGVGDLAGGTLRDANGSTYGPFQQSAPGSYAITLTWSALSAVNAITFTDSASRQLVAEFFDSSGKHATGAVTIRFTCPGGDNGTPSAKDGKCGLTCLDYARMCNGKCLDVRADKLNCGSCGRACQAPAGGTAACSGGHCQTSCPGGKAICDFACTDTRTDPENCGGCNRACPPQPSGGSRACVAGQCQITCPSGRQDCEDSCVDTSISIDHCGTCGNACTPLANGINRCISSQCQISCSTGYTLCNGACVNFKTDRANCGSCGHACGDYTDGYYACSNGVCATTLTCKGQAYKCGTLCCARPQYDGGCHYVASGLACGSH